MSYSVIIKNGLIIDGSGESSQKMDIGLKDDKISAIKNLDGEEADLVIDASGLHVAPGFIDITTHSDNHWTLFSQPEQESFLRQGITTIVGAHGGSSLAPILRGEALHPLLKWIDTSRININWQTTAELLGEIEKIGISINFATLTGYDTLKKNIFGDEIKPAGRKEVEAINNLLQKSLDEGSFGLSTNFKIQHDDIHAQEEMKRIFSIITKNNAISIHHIEDEGGNLLPSVSQLITILRESRARGHIAHFKALGKNSWEKFPDALNMIEVALKENVKITCDFFPYTNTGSNLLSLLPRWLTEKINDDILKTIQKADSKQHLIDELKKLTLHYDKIIIASTEKNIQIAGKSMEVISEELDLSPEETIIRLLEINDLRVSIFNEVISEQNIDLLCKKTYSIISSDGVGQNLNEQKNTNNLPHPRSFGTFPRAISEFVKEKGIISWEKIIQKMSGLPAEILGLTNRGLLKEGYFADITIINPETIKDKATYFNPFQYSKGINYVFVNGQLVLSDEKLLETKHGKALKKQKA